MYAITSVSTLSYHIFHTNNYGNKFRKGDHIETVNVLCLTQNTQFNFFFTNFFPCFIILQLKEVVAHYGIIGI